MYDRRNHAKRLLFGGLLLGSFAALWLAAVEVIFLVAWEGGARLQGAPGSVVLYDGLTILLLGPLVGLIFGSLASTVHLIASRAAGQRGMEPIWKARCHTVLAVPLVAYVANQAFSGPWISRVSGSRLMAMATGGVLLAATYVGSRIVVRHGHRLAVGHSGKWMRRLAAPTMLLLAAGLYLADQLVLPRLYPFFHWTLAGLAALAAWLGAGALHLAFDRLKRRSTGRLARPYVVAMISCGVMVLGLLGQRSIGRSNLQRALVFERTGLGSKVLTLSQRAGVLPQPRELRAVKPPAKTKAVVHRPPPYLRGADVVLITVDALRGDRLGLAGYRRRVDGKAQSITPNIDRLFGKGVRFTRAYCTTPRTSYSVVSLLTGQPIYTLARLGERRPWPTLAEVLSADHGYRTAGFYPLAIFTIDGRWFEHYRTEHLGFTEFRFEDEDLPAAKRTDQVIAFLDRYRQSKREEPLFVWAHYFDPHEPYRVRPGYRGFGRSASARYDAEIAYVDAEIGRLVNAVKQRRRRVLFVLAADHGEEFGEHGGANHGTSVFDEQVRVPLLLAGPGLPDRQVDVPVSLTGVPATILRLLKHRVPLSMSAGPDLTEYMDPGSRPTEGGALCEVGSLRMYARGRDKLVQNTQRRYAVLYDLKRDPRERKPLSVDHPGKAQKRAAVLLGHLRERLRELERTALRYRQMNRPGTLALALSSPEPERRRAAARELMLRASDRKLAKPSVTALRRALKSVDPEVRQRARIALAADAGRAGKKVDVQALEKIMVRPDLPDDMRRVAGLALAAVRDPAALKPLVSLLPRLADVDSRLEVIRALGRLGGASRESVQALIVALEDHETAVEAMRALRRLSRSAVAAPHVTEAVPALGRLLGHRSEHMGQRAEILATLACIGTARARARVTAWLPREAERSVRAAGLGLLARLPPPRSPAAAFFRLPGDGVRGPAGACLSGKGCRLESAPVTVELTLPAWSEGRPVTLWLVVDEPGGKPPAIRVDGAAPRPGVAVPIRVGEEGARGRAMTVAGGCARQGPLPRTAFRYVVPAGQLANRRIELQLRDPEGKGRVVRAIALLPLAGQARRRVPPE